MTCRIEALIQQSILDTSVPFLDCVSSWEYAVLQFESYDSRYTSYGQIFWGQHEGCRWMIEAATVRHNDGRVEKLQPHNSQVTQ